MMISSKNEVLGAKGYQNTDHNEDIRLPSIGGTRQQPSGVPDIHKPKLMSRSPFANIAPKNNTHDDDIDDGSKFPRLNREGSGSGGKLPTGGRIPSGDKRNNIYKPRISQFKRNEENPMS